VCLPSCCPRATRGAGGRREIADIWFQLKGFAGVITELLFYKSEEGQDVAER
jgi:hypothetical protein